MSRKIYKSVAELIGNTLFLEVTGLEKELKLEATVLVKLEYLNPTGRRKGQNCKKHDCRCRRERDFKAWSNDYSTDLR